MTRHGIDLDSPPVREFCRTWKIKELAVFGSIVRDDFGPESDIDFVVDHEEDAVWDLSDSADMRRDLSAILGRDVDVLTRNALNRSDNWLFRKIVLTEMETVYAAR